MKGAPKNVILVTVGLSDPTNPENVPTIVWGSGWKAGFCRLESTGVFVWGRG